MKVTMRLFLGLLMALASAGAASAVDPMWTSFFGLQPGGLSGAYDLSLLGRTGLGNFGVDGFKFQLLEGNGSTADGRIDLTSWDPMTYTMTGDLSVWTTFYFGGAQDAGSGTWSWSAPCSLSLTFDKTSFRGTCHGASDLAVSGRTKGAVPPPPAPVADESAAWLQAHNDLRAALSVKPLTWDASLAQTAQGYADRLAQNGTSNNNCTLGHNLYGYTLAGGTGENLAGAWKRDEGPAKAVQDWASEQPYFDAGSCQCSGKECRHYTQVVSQWSTKLGCGQAACNDDMGTWHFYVCNYQGPGNLVVDAATRRLKAPYPAACPAAQNAGLR